jgi:5-methylcytosine-specific restriction endonuclease McrA
MNSMMTLKLDSSFRPLDVIDSVEALVLCIVGKAKAIENYTKKINSVRKSFELPAVIVLNKYIKFRFSYMACNRANILWRDDYRCQYCSNTFKIEKLTLDHVVPKSRGGDNSWKNLVTACKKCNQRKGNKTPSEAGMHPIRSPYEPKMNILKSINKEQISPKWKNYLWDFV